MSTVDEAIATQVKRLKTTWPAQRWTEDLQREYVEALKAIGDLDAVRDGTTAAVRGWGGNFPPPVASLLMLVRDSQRKLLEQRKERARDDDGRRHSWDPTPRTGPLEDHEVAPAWWARLVQGAILNEAHSGGNELGTPERTRPYEDIARRHGVMPRGIGEKLDGTDSEPHVRAAIAEAKAYGERSGDDVPSSHRELADLPLPAPTSDYWAT